MPSRAEEHGIHRERQSGGALGQPPPVMGYACANMTDRPNFLVLGVSKTGTGVLCDQLQQHPSVYVSPNREPHFFALGELTEQPSYAGPVPRQPHPVVSRWQDYQALYAGVKGETAIGEASTSNFQTRACQRIRQYIPDARLILVLRHPADRAYSQFVQNRRTFREPLPDFERALAAEEQRRREGWWPGFHYAAENLYADRLSLILDAFARSRISIHLFDDLTRDRAGTLGRMIEFLGADPGVKLGAVSESPAPFSYRHRGLQRLVSSYNPVMRWIKPLLPSGIWGAARHAMERANRTPPPALDPELRRRLTRQFSTDLRRVQALTGIDLTSWLDA
jgi:hypothetical protein